MNKKIITTCITKIIYKKTDSNWYILKTDQGIAKGVVNFDIKERDLLRLEGFYKRSNFNGTNEFIFQSALISIPEDPRALLHYAVTLTKGLGESAEEKIWNEYEEKWINTDLTGIQGISDETKFNWLNTLIRLKEQEEQTQAISFLLSKGATLNMASSAWQTWKEQTVSTVTSNCYKLAELPYYGFYNVDSQIRKHFGIKDKDPRRIQAAILYIMNDLSQKSGTLINRSLINDELTKIIPDVIELIDNSINQLITNKKVKLMDSNNYALFNDWKHENLIWQNLKR